MKSSLWSSFKSFPLRQRALFLFFILILPKTLSSVLLYINLAGIGLMLLFSAYKTVKFFIQLLQKNNTSVQGFTINYAQHSDTTFLSDEIITSLQQLKDINISKVAYTGNCLYLYQEIKEKPDTTAFFTSLFQKQHHLTETEKAELTQKTISYIQQPAFLSLLLTQE